MSKRQLVGILADAAISLLSGGILTAFAYRYFTAELKEGTPFTNAGADRIKQLGIMEIALSVISMSVIDGIYENFGLAEWSRLFRTIIEKIWCKSCWRLTYPYARLRL